MNNKQALVSLPSHSRTTLWIFVSLSVFSAIVLIVSEDDIVYIFSRPPVSTYRLDSELLVSFQNLSDGADVSSPGRRRTLKMTSFCATVVIMMIASVYWEDSAGTRRTGEGLPSAAINSSLERNHTITRTQANNTKGHIGEYKALQRHAQPHCGVRIFWKKFTHPRCITRTVPIQGCHGYCTSYHASLFTSAGQFSLHKSCECCQQYSTRRGYVLLHCPRDNTSKIRRVNIEGATQCTCRPCMLTSF